VDVDWEEMPFEPLQLLAENVAVMRELAGLCRRHLAVAVSPFEEKNAWSLLLSVSDNLRRHAETGVKLHERLSDLQTLVEYKAALDRFQEGVIKILGEVDRDLAERAVERLLKPGWSPRPAPAEAEEEGDE
jgi:hypothetical protein